jgi:hypothetical protein
MTASPRAGATDWAASQASPWLVANAATRRIEAGACRFPVADRVTAPPGSCSDGATYLIIATATGAFAGKENQLATAVGANAASGWYYRTLGTIDEGARAYVQDEDVDYNWSGSAWSTNTAVADLTSTATSGSLPTPNGSITIANAATPTVVELLEYCVELEAKLEALLSRVRASGIIAP